MGTAIVDEYQHLQLHPFPNCSPAHCNYAWNLPCRCLSYIKL